MDKIAILSEILAANPADSFARYGLGMEFLGRGDTGRALAEFEETTRQNADYVPAYQMSGQTLAKLQRTQEAKARLQAGLQAAQRTRNQHAASEMQALLDELDRGY